MRIALISLQRNAWHVTSNRCMASGDCFWQGLALCLPGQRLTSTRLSHKQAKCVHWAQAVKREPLPPTQAKYLGVRALQLHNRLQPYRPTSNRSPRLRGLCTTPVVLAVTSMQTTRDHSQAHCTHTTNRRLLWKERGSRQRPTECDSQHNRRSALHQALCGRWA